MVPLNKPSRPVCSQTQRLRIHRIDFISKLFKKKTTEVKSTYVIPAPPSEVFALCLQPRKKDLNLIVFDEKADD